jgi:hypothetical protein
VLGGGHGDFLGESLFVEEGKLCVKVSDGAFLEILTLHFRNQHTYTFKNQKYIKGGLIFNAIFLMMLHHRFANATQGLCHNCNTNQKT